MPGVSRGGAEPEAQTDATLGVAAVARRLGVATGTLRTWDRRYGLGPSEHPPGSRRRYTPSDVARLDALRRLMLEGVSVAEAARVVLATHTGAGSALAPAKTATGRTPRASVGARAARAGGGRVVPLPTTTPSARGLARAGMSLDSDACDSLIRASLQRTGVVATWENLLAPVLTGIEERRRTTGRGLEVERLVGERCEAVIRAVAKRGANDQALRPILLAGVSEERRRLPLIVLEAALRERGLPVRFLGVRLPLGPLADAMTRVGPSAVVLWSQRLDAAASVPEPELLARVRPRPALVLVGPGYRSERFHSGVVWAAGVGEAVSVILDRVGAPETLTIGP